MSQNEAGTLTCPSCYKITPDCMYTITTTKTLERRKEMPCMLVKTQEHLSSETICESCEEKSAYCEDYALLICSACIDNHKKMKPLRLHTILSLKSDQSISHKLPQCSIHSNESVKFYCSSCTCLVCSE